MKPLKIAVYGDPYAERIGIGASYHIFLSKFGDVMVMTPMEDYSIYLEHADVLVLPGGADVDTLRYKERPRMSGKPSPFYEYLDTTFLVDWIKTGKPIIGICRGMQTLNVALGGSLIQHVKDHVGGQDRTKEYHKIYSNILGFKRYGVNSYHHQALGRIADGLEVLAWSLVYSGCPSLYWNRKELMLRPEYEKPAFALKGDSVKFEWSKDLYFSIAEIVQHRTLPYIAFQYHPEETDCQLANMKITEVLAKAYPDRTKELTYKILGDGKNATVHTTKA